MRYDRLQYSIHVYEWDMAKVTNGHNKGTSFEVECQFRNEFGTFNVTLLPEEGRTIAEATTFIGMVYKELQCKPYDEVATNE